MFKLHYSARAGADLGFFVLQSKKNRTGRGQRRTWWTPRGLNNFNADSPYIKFDSTFEEMIV